MLPLFTAVLLTALPAQTPVVPAQATTAPAQAAPQAPGDVARGDDPATAALVSDAWAALARGDVRTAGAKLAALQGRAPRSAPVVALNVEVALATGGVPAALTAYNQWLGARTTEDPLLLRRIATAILVDAEQRGSSADRLAAMAALAADGDTLARQALQARSASGSLADAAALAAAGDQAGIRRVATAVAGPAPNKVALVESLAASGNPAAIPALLPVLDDPRPEHQAAAAAALGHLGAHDQVPRLRALLAAPNQPPYVKLAAAGALFELGDTSGRDQLQSWLQSEVPAMRAAAAKAMSSQPDDAWLGVVRGLTTASDPLVRIDAAKLLAKRDPAEAAAVLERLGQDPDGAVRDLAQAAMVAMITDDLTRLKTALGTPATRLQAASRLLELTR